MLQTVQKSFSENDFAVTDLSHSRAIIELEGENSKEILKKGCPFNFNELKKDICIIKHQPKGAFKISMKPAKNFISFDKLKKGSFVRAMGSPGGMTGHTAEGSIQWKGTMENLASTIYAQMLQDTETSEDALEYTKYFLSMYDKDTKLIVHGATIHLMLQTTLRQVLLIVQCSF